MRSSVIVEVAIAFGDVGKPAITDEPDAVQALLFERPKEPLDVRIAVGRARRNTDNGDACAGQHAIEARFAKFSAAVVNQMGDAMLCEEPGIDHGQVAGDLLHDDRVRMSRDREDVYLVRCDDHGHAHVKHFPPCQRQYGDTGKVDTSQR